MLNTLSWRIRFQNYGIASIVIVYLLILVGGIVRSTGSGMGCPDWPTCFGRIIPPTKESELPANYQEIYSNHGKESTKFNPVKTWIEYVNRLFGALTGVVVLVFFLLSFSYKKSDPTIVYLSGLILLLVIIQGIIGKYVVQMNLKGETVSLHFWGSIVIILVLIYTVARARMHDLIVTGLTQVKKLKMLILFIIALTIVQLYLGTQVRHQVEAISIRMDYSHRDTWIGQVSNVFYYHRSFSIIVLFAHLYFFFSERKSNTSNNILSVSTVLLIGILAIEIVAGIVMNYLDFPAFVQPVHMLFGSLLIGVQFFILYLLNFSVSNVPSKFQLI